MILVLSRKERKKLALQAGKFGEARLADVLDTSKNPADGTFNLQNLDDDEAVVLRSIANVHKTKLLANGHDKKAAKWAMIYTKLAARLGTATAWEKPMLLLYEHGKTACDTRPDVNDIPDETLRRYRAVIASHLRSIICGFRDRGRPEQANDEAAILELIGKDGERLSFEPRKEPDDEDSEVLATAEQDS